MELDDLRRNWEVLGEEDPMWAILSVPDRKGGKWNVEEFFATGVEDIRVILAAASTLNIDIRRGAALDFGCGVGRMTQGLAPSFESVVGVDVSEPMVRQANAFNRFRDRCRYVLNTDPDLRCFADEQFDFCMTFLVLQHMDPDYAKGYLRELGRVLRPGGVLLFQIPTSLTIEPWVASSLRAPRSKASPGGEATGVIEMYATPFNEVAAVLAESRVEIISARPDGRAGPEFVSHEFWGIKT